MEQEVEKILEKKWQPLFGNFKEIENGKYPGVYLIAWTEKNLTGQEIELEDIFYVGMSNARKGLLSRLKQFIDGVEKNNGHSAGMRFFKEYSNNVSLSKMQTGKRFYIVTSTFECDVNKKTRTANDLKVMGDICRLEYYLLAAIKERIGKEPELNKK
jgi:hypothetical protein